MGSELLEGNWLTLDAVMRHLGKSQATVERLVRANAIESRLVEVKGRKPMRLYRAESVSGLAKTGTVVPVLTPKPPTKTEISAQRHVMASLHEVMTKFLEQNRVSVRHKIWLSLEEAQAYSGRSRKYLLKLVKEGRIFAEKDGGWRIHRASLEAFAG